VIFGREEARLIYLGVAHPLPPSPDKRLVVDIGGGSTEFIIGSGYKPQKLESLYMGCVSYTLRFFPGGKVDKKSFREAEVAAAQEIEAIAIDYQRFGWGEAIGTSGSARAIADLLELNDLNPGGVSGITRQGLDTLRTLMLRAGSAEAMDLEGLRSDRLPVLPGGIAIMCAVFSELGIEHMNYADGALRLGVLYDLLGRFHHHDMRDATVLQFMRRYRVDERQALRVENTALRLLRQLIDVDAPEHENDLRFLKWAVSLHEIGISVAHNGYHKHGAYILNFADMPGFSKKDQARLGLLVLGQRGKLEKLAALPQSDDATWRLIFCLRLAAVLHRSRDDHALPDFRVKCAAGGYQVELPDDWLAVNPLSAAVLSDESLAWHRTGTGLRIKRRSMATAEVC
jgi:exopolyphosphatase/guanosine-5'-triphosphate,3'-diphosphate pyrophosphatase